MTSQSCIRPFPRAVEPLATKTTYESLSLIITTVLSTASVLPTNTVPTKLKTTDTCLTSTTADKEYVSKKRKKI